VLFAPRIAPRLQASVLRHARTPLTPAEITRRLGAEAERHGLPRPCYQQVRVLVRRARRARERSWGFVLEVGFGVAIGSPSAPRVARIAADTVIRPLDLIPALRR